MNRDLKIDIETLGPVVVLHLSGFMAQLEVYKLKNQIDVVLGQGMRFIILDMRGLDFIDSAGIGAIIHLRTACMQSGGQVLLVYPDRQQARSALDTSTVISLVRGFESVDLALDHLRERHGVMTPSNAARAEPATEAHAAATSGEDVKHIAERLGQIERRLSRIEFLLEQKLG